MFESTDICAIIVSYNCDRKIIDNIGSLLDQVKHVVVYDNGSTDLDSINILRSFEGNEKVEIYLFNTNEGVSIRLNQGLDLAKQRGYKLLLTMDQDTILESNCVEEMLNVLNTNTKIVSVGPNRKRSINNKSLYTIVNYLITSGNLSIIDDALFVGGYYNKLFIDKVDIDFSFALRKNGFMIAVANNAYMIHKVGEYETNTIMGFKVKYLSHSPKRFYYIYRNALLVLRRYFHSLPIDCTKMMLIQIFEFAKMVVFEKDRKEKIICVKKGILDGLKNEEQRRLV